MTTILAPIDLSAPKQVGPRVFRKQILRKAVIGYPDGKGGRRKIAFDDEFIADLANAYNAGAYDNVPFILADASNAHTMAPERFRGWVKGVEVTPDGLDAIIELSADAAELIERTGGKLGVSPRIKPVEHVDGRRFPKAINHVLGTLDPRQQGEELRLRDWEPIDLSHPTDDVLDLSGARYQEGSTMPKMIDLSALSDEQRAGLETWAAAQDIDLSELEAEQEPDGGDKGDEGTQPLEPGPGGAEAPGEGDDQPGNPDEDGTGDGEGDDGEGEGATSLDAITDEELDALIDAELEALGEAGVSLSAEDDGTDPLGEVDLAAGLVGVTGDEAKADRTEAARLRFQIAARDYRDAGVPPHLIDLAEPILSLSDDEAEQIDLSSPATGEPIDVRGIVRDMLDAVKGTIDLSREDGYGHESGQDAQGTDLADRWTAYLENN